MSASTFTFLALAFAVLIAAVSTFKIPAEQVTSLEQGLGPKVIASPL